MLKAYEQFLNNNSFSNLVTLDLSVMSMLAEPNTESPANVDAAKMWREDRCFDHVQIFNYIKHQMRNDPLIINFCSPLN